MKREIKFRCFDKQYKTMHNVNMILFSTNELDHDGNNGEPKSIDHFELMQFTGLHDKNGKEIYEGDIYNYNDAIRQVFFNNGCFVGGFYETNNGYPIGYDDQGISDFATKIEVIGNIYENTDLLQP